MYYKQCINKVFIVQEHACLKTKLVIPENKNLKTTILSHKKIVVNPERSITKKKLKQHLFNGLGYLLNKPKYNKGYIWAAQKIK